MSRTPMSKLKPGEKVEDVDEFPTCPYFSVVVSSKIEVLEVVYKASPAVLSM